MRDDGAIIPFEVKSGSNSKAKSLQSFVHKYHPPYQVILSGKNFHYDTNRKKYQIPLYLSAKKYYKIKRACSVTSPSVSVTDIA